jgi:hypothetical protein
MNHLDRSIGQISRLDRSIGCGSIDQAVVSIDRSVVAVTSIVSIDRSVMDRSVRLASLLGLVNLFFAAPKSIVPFLSGIKQGRQKIDQLLSIAGAFAHALLFIPCE